MAIAPLPLPSPKFGDPSQMEIANLKMFDDPYTSKMGGAFMTNLMVNRDANNAQYADAVAKQQGYYDRALQAQADESVLEALPKLLNAKGGTNLLPGVMGVRDILSRLTPGTFEGMQERANMGQLADTYKTGMEGAYQGVQAGFETSPQAISALTGVPNVARTPLSTTNELIQQAGANARAAQHASTEKQPQIQYAGVPGPLGMATITDKLRPGESMEEHAQRMIQAHRFQGVPKRPMPDAEGGSGPRDRTQGPTPGFSGTPSTSLKPAPAAAKPTAGQATPDQRAAVQRAIQADGKPTTRGNTIRGLGPDGKEVWIRYK
jgi:hypothetical protein